MLPHSPCQGCAVTILGLCEVDKGINPQEGFDGKSLFSASDYLLMPCVMDMVIFRTIFFELLVFFTFTLLTPHFAC